MDEQDLAELRELRLAAARKNVQRILDEKISYIESSIKISQEANLAKTTVEDGAQEDSESSTIKIPKVATETKDYAHSEEIRKFTWSQTENSVE